MALFFVEKDISLAKTIAKDVYLDEKVFAASREKIFARSWQWVGHEDQLSLPGSLLPFSMLKEYLNEPLLLSKDDKGKIHCLSNVCTHRGNLLITSSCKANDIRCKYHGRRFDLKGSFKSMPEFKEVKNFPSADDNLHQLPVFQWGKMLFSSLNAQHLASAFFAEMLQRLEWLPLNEFVYNAEYSKEYRVKANWALYCENYLEGFHIPFVHAGLNSIIDYGNYTTELYKYSSLQLGISKGNEYCFDLPSNSADFGKSIAAYYFWVFPNMMFNFYPWGLSVNVVEPITISESVVKFYTFIWKESLFKKGAGGNLDQVELEDEEIVENVQMGIRSRFYQQGRYSVTREQGTHHFHRILAEFLTN